MKKTIKILSIIVALLFSVSLGVFGTLILTDQIKTPFNRNVDNEFLYSWLSENGKLENGTKLVYSFDRLVLESEKENVLTLKYTADNFEDTSGVGLYDYNLEITYDLYNDTFRFYFLEKNKYTIGENEYSSLYYTTKLDTSCSVDIKKFTRNSPISYSYQHNFEYENENEEYPWTWSQEAIDVDRQNIKERNNSLVDMSNTLMAYFTGDIAHKYIIDFLDCIEKEFCPIIDISLSDLGFEVYK